MAEGKKPIDVMMDQIEWKETGCEPEGDGSLPYATHSGILIIPGYVDAPGLKCYQLNTGERVFDAEDIARFFNGEIEEA